MEELVLSFRDLIDRVDTRFVRYLHNEIDWNSRLIAILGTRGVGKTTLLLQHIKLTDAITSSLYVTADDLYFSRKPVWRNNSTNRAANISTLTKSINTKDGHRKSRISMISSLNCTWSIPALQSWIWRRAERIYHAEK